MIFTNPIDDLASQINQRGGLAKPNYFAVTFTGPAAVSPNQFLLNAFCESASIPGRSFLTLEHGTTRQVTKRPYSFINDDVTLTFLVTNDFYMKNIFDKWMKHVVNDETGKIYYKSQYVSDMTIMVLDTEHDIVYKCQLQNAYPIAMTAIELSNASENQLIRVSVTMTYDNFTTNSTYFSLATSLADLKNALSFPNPLMPSLPFSPFGDLGDQAETVLAGLKSELAGELSGVLNSITSSIRDKITGNATSITTPYEGSLGSIVSQLSGKVSNIFGTELSTITGGSTSSSQSIVSRASSAVKGLFG